MIEVLISNTEHSHLAIYSNQNRLRQLEKHGVTKYHHHSLSSRLFPCCLYIDNIPKVTDLYISADVKAIRFKVGTYLNTLTIVGTNLAGINLKGVMIKKLTIIRCYGTVLLNNVSHGVVKKLVVENCFKHNILAFDRLNELKSIKVDRSGSSLLCRNYRLFTGDFHKVCATNLTIDEIVGSHYLKKLSLPRVRIMGPLTPESFDSLISLTKLDLSYTKFHDYSFLSRMTNLTHLNLRGSYLEDLSVIRGLRRLLFLDISDAKITDLDALSGLVRLRILKVSCVRATDHGVIDVSNSDRKI